MKRKLSNVTLIGIDCVNVERLMLAMDICEKEIEFGAVKLLTSLPTNDPRKVEISPIKSIEAYSDFCVRELENYVDTDFVLIVQYDGFILNPQSWNDEFLKYDYIGAPWLVADWSVRDFDFPESLLGHWVVGNGGFCLRSKKFVQTCARLAREGKILKTHPEDVVLCVWNRDLFEKEEIRFAPVELAKQFSIEGEERDGEYKDQFGFHGFSWTDIDMWIEAHPEYPLIAKQYHKARAEHFERQAKRAKK